MKYLYFCLFTYQLVYVFLKVDNNILINVNFIIKYCICCTYAFLSKNITDLAIAYF